MVGQRVKRRVGGSQHFDVELVVKRSWTEGRGGQPSADGLVVDASVGGAEPLFEPEELLESIVKPHTRGRAAEKVVRLCKANPYPAGLVLVHLLLPNAQVFHEIGRA